MNGFIEIKDDYGTDTLINVKAIKVAWRQTGDKTSISIIESADHEYITTDIKFEDFKILLAKSLS